MARSRIAALPRRARARRVAVIVLIVAFLAVDGVLIAMAATAAGVKPHGTLAPIPTFSSMPTPTPTPDGTPTPAPSSTTVAATIPSTAVSPRFLAAVSATTAWRATPGSCTGTPAVVEETTNGGGTWVRADLSKISARTVLFLSGGATSATVVSGATSSCTPAFFASFTSGRFWAPYPDRVSEASYIDPATHALYVAGTTTPSPCADPRQVAHTSTATAVVCPGELEARTGSGAWVGIPVPGLLAVAAAPNGWVVAVSGVGGCAGVAVQAMDGSLRPGMSVTTTGCAVAATPVGVTLSQSGPTLWLWSGDKTFVSSDSGANW
ncbi:hypothetical protein ACRAWC_15670 [Leifsonia sp. L25]|uniref:hypothetical protein n=1 Tax=Actinomycetes TaxID=1760 RepID=UPI000F0E47CA